MDDGFKLSLLEEVGFTLAGRLLFDASVDLIEDWKDFPSPDEPWFAAVVGRGPWSEDQLQTLLVLAALTTFMDAAESEIKFRVAAARALGLRWEDIAEAMDRRKQSVHRMFRDEIEKILSAVRSAPDDDKALDLVQDMLSRPPARYRSRRRKYLRLG